MFKRKRFEEAKSWGFYVISIIFIFSFVFLGTTEFFLILFLSFSVNYTNNFAGAWRSCKSAFLISSLYIYNSAVNMLGLKTNIISKQINYFAVYSA